MTAITDTKLRDKLMKEKKLELKKAPELDKQNTYKRKTKKIQYLKLFSQTEKKTRKTIKKVGKIRNKTENKIINDKTCKFGNAPNWNPTQKYLVLDKLCHNCGKWGHFARVCKQREDYKGEVQNVTKKETTAIGGDYESESSIYRIERKNRITDKNK